MTEIFSDYTGVEYFYATCAFIGGFFVIVRMILQFMGGDSDIGDHDIDIESGDDIDSDLDFKILSIQTLSAFFMMFGLVGLALYRQSEAGFLVSLLGGVVAGVIAVWVIRKLFKIARSFESSGTVPTAKAVGRTGTVYLKIPTGGTGRVSIPSLRRDCDAREKNGGELETGLPVRIIEVHANVLIVEKID